MPRGKSKAKKIEQPEPQKQEEKVQPKNPSRNPKKYTKKSQGQLERINRSKYQKIFLLNAERNENNWKFYVQGVSGSNYHLDVSTQMKCTCVDFRMKKKPCKHLYFIATQVAQNEDLVNYFKNDTKISANAYKLLDKQLYERLKSRMQPTKQKKDIDLKDDTDCTICFCPMEKQQQALQDCDTCKKYFHTDCINVWKNHNPTCPLCRGNLKSTGNNPLDKLTKITL